MQLSASFTGFPVPGVGEGPGTAPISSGRLFEPDGRATAGRVASLAQENTR